MQIHCVCGMNGYIFSVARRLVFFLFLFLKIVRLLLCGTCSEDGSSRFTRNVGSFLPPYTATCPRRHWSSYSLLREQHRSSYLWWSWYFGLTFGDWSSFCHSCQPKRMFVKERRFKNSLVLDVVLHQHFTCAYFIALVWESLYPQTKNFKRDRTSQFRCSSARKEYQIPLSWLEHESAM